MVEKIDLHGIRHHLVRNELIRKIEELWDTDTEVHIVTGHSEDMKTIVKDVLNEYKLEYSVGSFGGVNMGFIKTEI